MKNTILVCLLVFYQNLFLSQSIKGFHIPDSLVHKNFDDLQKDFHKNLYINKSNAEIYANTILLKGKKDKSHEKIADGYLMLHRLNHDKSALSYLDSMMVVSSKMQNSDYLAISYKFKGNYYYLKGDYSIALNNYLAAMDCLKNNNELFYTINFNIGLLKLELKEYRQALQLFLDYRSHLEKKDLINLDYLNCIYALAYTYSFINELNISDHYVDLGLQTNSRIKDKENEYGLLLVSGMNAYKRKEYQYALETLNRAKKIIIDNSFNSQNLAINEYYIGRVLYATNDKNFVRKFETVDSIITKTKNVTSELRDVYPLLIDYYKKMGDKEKQLFYIEHLLSVDSILNKNNSFLTTEINKKYDTPLLLKEKEILISDLHTKNHTLFWIIGIGGGIIIFLLYLYDKNRRKIKIYQSKADLLTQSSVDPGHYEIEDLPLNENLDFQKEKLKTTLSDDKLKQLSLKWQEFEIEKRFLDKKINLDILSKEFNINRAYLSRSVNELKGKNFPQYLNELRINYIILELKNNKRLQKLTIATVAEEAGYNSVESFTNAFKKITDTLPSYYIKALKENNNQ